MQIISLNIIEYAAIKDKKIDFSAGLNIIEGENESGKSSLLSFIKFMLYGFPKRSSGEIVSEKERGFSWTGGVAEGTMTIETSEGQFRVERSARAAVRGEKVAIIDLATGTPVHKGEVPGEVFLGVPLSVFESSACVKQLECSNIEGDDVGNALQNLLLSADEALNTEKATAKIESLRKKLLHKTKRGGSIYDLGAKRDALRTSLEDAKQESMQIMEYESSYENLNKMCSEFRAKLEENKDLLKAYQAKQHLIKFEMLSDARARIKSIEAEAQALKAEKCHEGFVPDSEYLRSLAVSERDYIASLSDMEIKRENEKAAKSPLDKENTEKAKKASLIEEEGGAESLSFRYSSQRKKSVRSLVFGIVFAVLGAISAAGAALGFFSLDIPKIADILGSSLMRQILASAAIFFVLGSAICFISASSAKKKAAGICEKFSLPKGTDEEKLYAHLCSCISAKDKCEEHESAVWRTEKEYKEAQAHFGEASDKLEALLAKVGKTLGEEKENPTKISELVGRVTDEAGALCEALASLDRDIAKYKALLEERERDVADLDEKELRRSLTPELVEKLNSVNITMLNREHEFLKAKTESAEQKKYFYDRELIRLRATSDDPLGIETLLQKTDESLAEHTYIHDALTLAAESIQSASESMRKNVTPRLRARASDIMSSFTDEKYLELGITSDFDITVNAGGVTRPIEVLSAGTRDAAYLSVRLALISVLYRGENPPLLLDEVLSQIDDKRALSVLKMLEAYCGSEAQCLLFSCHKRESSMIRANVIRL
ncbi:MAG: AAA family ATPase [Clostridia bacterium]|nr:AAA family ATPase [Clostridia bacterium]